MLDPRIPAPIIPDHIVDALNLRPFDTRTRSKVPGKLIGFWRSHEDSSHPDAAGPYKRQAENINAILRGEKRDSQHLSDSDLRPYGGSRKVYREAELVRVLERAKAWASLPWPGEHLDPSLSAEERERIAGLLDRGAIVASYRGCSNDRLDPGARMLNGCCERAEAGWIWPEGLSHYVRAYGLVLPVEMINDLTACFTAGEL